MARTLRFPVRNEYDVCSECFAEGLPHPNGDGGFGIFGSAPYLRVGYCDHSERHGFRARCPLQAGDIITDVRIEPGEPWSWVVTFDRPAPARETEKTDG